MKVLEVMESISPSLCLLLNTESQDVRFLNLLFYLFAPCVDVLKYLSHIAG